jgi:uncharacterized protein involved in outer membrane biogenesis
MLRKLFKIFAILGLLLVVAGAIFVAVFDFDEVINEQKDQYLPELAKVLGREVSAGDIATTFMPVLGAELRDVTIAGAKGGEAPLHIDRVVFELELWAALKSAGSDVRLKRLVIDGLTVDVTRHADGSLSIDDILNRLSEGPPPEEAPTPLDPEAKQFLRNLRLQRVALENTTVRFTDEATGGAPAKLAINDLNIELTDAALVSPIKIKLTAAVFADQRNLTIETTIGPIPLGDPEAALPIEFIALSADGLDLGPIGPYLGADSPVAISSAKINGTVRIDDPLMQRKGRDLNVDLKVAGLAFKGGESFDLATALKLSQPTNSGRFDLAHLRIALDDMIVSAKGSVSGLTTGRPNIEGLVVNGEKLDFDRIIARVPLIKASLPPGAVLSGPFTLKAQLDGDAEERHMKANLNFTTAQIRWPGALDKPKGTPLSQMLDAHHSGETLEIKDFDLQVGPMRLRLKGSVVGTDNPSVDIRGGTGAFAIDGLLRLLPAVRTAVPPDVKIGGHAEISLNAKGNAGAFDAGARIALTKADLAAPGATLRGSGAIIASAKGTPDALNATLNADLTGLAIQAGDGVRKASGTPLTADIALRRDGERLRLDRFAVVAGPAHLTGDGTLAQNGAKADLRFKLADFTLGDLKSLLPGAIEGALAAARVGLDATVRGNLNQPDTLAIEVPALRFSKGKSGLTASASVRNGPKPVIRFDAQSTFFDVDAVFPPGPPEPDAPAGGPPVIPEIVRTLDFRGRLRVAKGRASGVPFKNFDAQILLQDGVLTFQKLGMMAFDGQLSAANTRADLRTAEPKLTLNIDLKKVAIARVLTELAGMKRSLTGRLSSNIQLSGVGLTPERLVQSLTGALTTDLTNGGLKGAGLENALYSKSARKLPFLKLGQAREDLALKKLAAQFEVRDGKMHLKKPMDVETREGPIRFTGAIGLDGSLDLNGAVQIPPQRVGQLSRGKLRPKAAIPVNLRLGGTLTDPKFEGVESDKLAIALVALAGGAALGMVEDRLGIDAKAKIDQAKAQAEAAKAKALAQANSAKARAKAEAAKAKAAAKKKADAEKKKAKKKAKDKAKKALKGLF